MCPRENTLYREMTSGNLNGEYCRSLHLFQCNTCPCTEHLPISAAQWKKYLKDLSLHCLPLKMKGQRNCGNLKSCKTHRCQRFSDLWTQPQHYILLKLLPVIYTVIITRKAAISRTHSGYFNWSAKQVTVCVCHTCCMQNHLQILNKISWL